MPTRSKSQITTDVGRRLPQNRPPTHPGEMLFEEFVKPLGLTQAERARCLGVSYPRLDEIIKGRRSVTPDTALRLSRVLGMSADFWLGLQQDWDLWHAMNSPGAKQINRLKPIHQGPGGDAESARALDLAMIDRTAPLKIADIGCGTGAFTPTGGGV